MRKYRLKEDLTPTPPVAVASPLRYPANPRPSMAKDIERTVDVFVSMLKQELIQQSTNPQAQRGIWDRMKGWWANLTRGRYNPDNPYFWKNKLGDELGRTTESVMPLEEFRLLHDYALQLELALPPGTEKLQLVKIIDDWAARFKQSLVKLVNRDIPLALPGDPEDIKPETPAKKAPTTTLRKAPGTMLAPEPPEEPVPAEKPAPVENPEVKKLKDELEAVKDKFPSSTYELLLRNVESGNEHQMNLVRLILDRKRVAYIKDAESVGKTTTPETPPAAPEEKPEAVPTPTTPEDPSIATPKTDDRPWKELSAHEKTQWDMAGGGNAGDSTWNARQHHEIRTLPWILRIGDPRLKHIEAIPGHGLYNRLVRQKRIENPTNPIRTAAELEKAVEEAKKLAYEERDVMSTKRLAQSKRKLLRQNIKSRLEEKPEEKPSATPPEAPAEPATPETAPPAEKPPKKPRRVAKMKLPPPETEATPEQLPNRDDIRQGVEALKDSLDDSLYEKLHKWATSDNPELVAMAGDKLKTLQALSGEHKRGGDEFDAIETTVFERRAALLDHFRHLAHR